MGNSRPAAHVCKLYDTQPTHIQQQTALATTQESFKNPDVQCGEQVCTNL